jgi:hypothetical protein
MRRMLLNQAGALQDGVEPFAAANGDVYRVRAWSTVLKQDIGSFTADARFAERVGFAEQHT